MKRIQAIEHRLSIAGAYLLAAAIVAGFAIVGALAR